jgi:hypothetical protein
MNKDEKKSKKSVEFRHSQFCSLDKSGGKFSQSTPAIKAQASASVMLCSRNHETSMKNTISKYRVRTEEK